jgi:septal ring factor EnvC (AmiA/AmiB activator)
MSSPTNLEIQGSFMRVPPPKDLTRAMERRRSSEEAPPKPVTRRSITLTNRSTVNTPSSKKQVPTTSPQKPETRQSNSKNDDTEAMKTKISHLEDEIRRLKRRIEELEKEVAELQKQIKTKDKRIAELTKENEEFKKRVNSFIQFVMIHLFLIGNQLSKTNRRSSCGK